MGEFGHFGFGADSCRIDVWGAGPFTIAAAGRCWTFEDSDRFGPALLTKTGDIAERQPSEKSPFWAPYHAWRKQGRRLAEDGRTCVWEPLKPTIMRQVRGQHYKVVEPGDDDGPIVLETRPIRRRARP